MSFAGELAMQDVKGLPVISGHKGQFASWDAKDEHFAQNYQESMAGPALSADGLEATVSDLRKAFILTTNVRNDELAPRFDDVELDLEPPPVAIIATSSIIELFEGVVQSVGDQEIDVVLRAKRNQETPDHVMSISLKFVQPQDKSLVRSGAVFYLTMFIETTGRTVRNVEEIRFRREPDWTPAMFRKLDELAAQL